MYYCFCKLYNKKTKELKFFGRWYKDKHYNNVPKMLMNTANKIKENSRDESEYNSFILCYACFKVTASTVVNEEWYEQLYKTFDMYNNWDIRGKLQ